MAGKNIVELKVSNFDEIIAEPGKPILVDFWASWCGPCRAVAPIIEELADEYAGKAIVGKVNVDEESGLSQKFRIMSIPTIMIFKDGLMVDKVVGARTKEEFEALLDKNL